MKNKTITAPKGFLAAGISCGIKKSKKLDLGIIFCPTGAKAAGVFTTNKVVSAAVTICKNNITSNKVFGLVVNSGNANACTGKAGFKDAQTMCKHLSKYVKTKPETILVASTGIIGEKLPISKITDGISKAVQKISSSPAAGLDFAKAIMTTDIKVKQAYRSLDIAGKRIIIAGTVKGAGMISPGMATTLLFITTDVAISKILLQKALKKAVDNSLNKFTVDMHQSTNDTALLLTSCLAGNTTIAKPNQVYRKFEKALCEMCDDLVRQMALDAEGATKMFKIVVEGVSSKSDAQKAARAIADYPLFKCAANGSDPNWGRIMCAAGSCGVKINPEKTSCKIGNIQVFKNGKPTNFDKKKAFVAMSQKEIVIKVALGAGKKQDFCYGCDMSKEYVKINADYHT